MSSFISIEYFDDAFGTTSGLNTGIMVSIILIALLIFLELTQAVAAGKKTTTLVGYRAGFSMLSAILFVILLGMVFTKVVMIIAV